jgi:hypothetical protein
MNSTQEKQLSGVLGFFDEPHALLEAMKKVREANFQSFDAFTPYPVHGLEAAQGLKRSWLPFVTFGAGLTGAVSGFLLQYWTSAVDWPIIVGGKPMNSWPAFVPVMFECTVLFAGLATVGAMFLANGLPNVKKKAFDPALTKDRFALLIEAPAPLSEEDLEKPSVRERMAKFRAFSEKDAADFLKSVGAKEVRTVFEEGWF